MVVFSRSEYTQAEFAASLTADLGRDIVASRVRWCLGDVRDPDRLRMAFHGADVVIHAAALKRVDAVAQHPDETVKTNIIGTMNVCRAAMDCGVPRVLCISSDKAVEAHNSYGASKAMAEWVATGFNTYSVPRGTQIATIRYGNLLGSRGSVVHVWRQAIRENRLLPLTDPAATRFVITMSQALGCINEAIEQMQGGEIFVPRLPWCYVQDIGLALGVSSMAFKTVGLRAGGEKIHEQLLSNDERHRCSETTLSYVVLPHIRSWGVEKEWGFSHSIPEYVSGMEHIRRLLAVDLAPLIAAVPDEGAF